VKKQSILYLTFDPPKSTGGGLGTYMDQIVHMTNASGQCALILHIDSSLPSGKSKISFRGSVEILSWNPHNSDIFHDMGYWPSVSYCISEKIRDLVQSGRHFDCIEACDGFALAYFSIHRKLAGEPIFVDQTFCITAHTPIMMINEWCGELNYRLPNYWTGQMERFCLLAADHVVSPSNFLVGELKQWGVNRDDIHVIHNPYKAPAPETIKADTPREDSKKNLGHEYLVASRVQHFKGIPELLAGFDIYWREGGTSNLTIAGGDTHSNLFGRSLTSFLTEKYSKWIKLGKLNFSGLLSQGDLECKRLNARALFHPSLKENFPYTVIEHMALGGIVAASASGGQAELIKDQESGFLFDPQQPKQIVEVIQKLDAMEDTAARRMGNLAQSVVAKKCDPTVIATQKQKLFSSRGQHRDKYPFIRGRSAIVPAGEDETPGLLSVVIPYYNLPDFLPETIDSVLASIDVDLEIIIVDDGSTTAEARAAADAQLLKDARIKIIRKENSGVADTRNVGISAAKGEFVALLDADDLISANYYLSCLRILNRFSNVGYVGCWNEDFNEAGRIRVWPTFNPEPPTQFIFNSTNCQGIVVRRQAMLKHGLHDKELKMFLDDWECTINLLANDIRGVMIPHPLFHYRIRGDSIFRSKQGLWHTNYEKILHKHSKLVQDFAVDAVLFLNQNGPNTQYHNPTWPPALATTTQSARVQKYRSPARQALSDLARSLQDWRRETLKLS